MNFYNKGTAKPSCVLVIDTTLSSDNYLCLKKNLLGRIKELIMTINDQVTDEEIQHDIKRKPVKVTPLS